MEKEKALLEIIPDGPLKVSGNYRLTDSNGAVMHADGSCYLCRCGGSAKKPFCDGSHKRLGFSG